ncbi:MAG: OB-fold nucleic acid binding domain-containing protein, partial [Patescibacteria group bacterium]
MGLEEIRDARIEKLKKLWKARVNPYPSQSSRTHTTGKAVENFDKLAKEGKKLVLVGRIMAKREHGGSTFLDIEDGTGKIQLLFKKDTLGSKDYQFFLDTIDIGDFIEARGTLFKTKQEEKTLLTTHYSLLTKSLLPLPEKWHGLQDVEEKYRKRYLD